MTFHHVAVWIDQNEAKLFRIDRESTETLELAAPQHHLHRHPKPAAQHNHPADADHFYHSVVQALEGAQEVLVMGPARAKLELIKHIHKHDPAFVSKIVGVETVDHPTDKQMIAHARDYFIAADRRAELGLPR
jgi:stalled ribosome rescue protein Dom34